MQLEIKIEARVKDAETGNTLYTKWIDSADAARLFKRITEKGGERQVRLIPRYDEAFLHDMDSPQSI